MAYIARPVVPGRAHHLDRCVGFAAVFFARVPAPLRPETFARLAGSGSGAMVFRRKRSPEKNHAPAP